MRKWAREKLSNFGRWVLREMGHMCSLSVISTSKEEKDLGWGEGNLLKGPLSEARQRDSEGAD